MDRSATWIAGQEKLAIECILKTRRCNDLLQIGELIDGGWIEYAQVSRRFYIGVHHSKKSRAFIQAQSDCLPIHTESMDIVLLLHQLETTKDPIAMLEEAYRVLRPNGQLIIVGFNRWSTWHWLHRKNKAISPGKVKRCLNHIDFNVTRYETRCFWPPLLWLDMLGQFLLPYMGGVFIVCATKEIPGMTPLVVNHYRSANLQNAHETT